ncbi:hypothetical protein E2C01_064916 [Portunus trituberculatus]|uniref:Uncharacterized protein n=1 Tax=Portunus trituberculatus TaxID=210409 RepID=A0A5B7HD43_PORTR|nr:hypothetical protein [Portunus trituberculatus]
MAAALQSSDAGLFSCRSDVFLHIVFSAVVSPATAFVKHVHFLILWLDLWSAVMSGLEDCTALPPEVSCYGTSRKSTSRSSRDGVKTNSRGRSESPARQGRRHVGHRRRHIVINHLTAWDKLIPKHPLLRMLCLNLPGIWCWKNWHA